jgi:hypothetical protein
MEKGQLRCDANVSIRNPDGSFGTKTELKNMNSFRFVEKGIARELERQQEILEGGGRIEQTTLHYDPETDEVHELRSKEFAHDYRYFPEPDLLPLELSAAYVREIEERMPELPDDMRARFEEQYGLSRYDAGVLAADRDLAAFYESVAADADPKQAANWISGDFRALLNESGTGVAGSKVTPGHVIELIELVSRGEVSRSAARDVLARVFESGDRPATVVEREGLGIRRRRRALRGGGRRDLLQPRRGRARPGRRQEGGRLPRRPGDEGDPRQRRRRARAPASHGEAGLLEPVPGGARPRVGVPAADLADALRGAGAEPVPLELPSVRPQGGVALAREWVADATQISCARQHLDGLLLAAEEPEELAGLVLVALRLNLLRWQAPVATSTSPPHSRRSASCPSREIRHRWPSRSQGAAVPRTRDLVDGLLLVNALRAGLSLGGGPELLVHLSAIAGRRRLRILAVAQGNHPRDDAARRPDSGWFAEHGVAGLLARLGDALNDTGTVSGRLRELVLPSSAVPEPPRTTGSRLTFVEARASGASALCRLYGAETEISGQCRVCHTEKLAVNAVEEGSLETPSLLVVGGCGPRGGPGLARLERLSRVLEEEGLIDSVPVITDGLPPRSGSGTWISLFSPEAAVGWRPRSPAGRRYPQDEPGRGSHPHGSRGG